MLPFTSQIEGIAGSVAERMIIVTSPKKTPQWRGRVSCETLESRIGKVAQFIKMCIIVLQVLLFFCLLLELFQQHKPRADNYHQT